MIFRRLKTHVEKENWFAVFIDFAIVVIGVFIGIQVANWNEARVNQRTEITYLDLLKEDLQTTRGEVENQIDFEQFQLEVANSLVPLIDQPPSELRQREVGLMLTRLGVRRTLKIDSPTFLDLQSSGRLGLISDADLRNAILSYFFAVQRLEAVIEKNNEHFIDERFNTFLDDASIGYWLPDGPPPEGGNAGVFTSIAERQRTQIDPALIGVGNPVLMSSDDDPFWNDLKARLGVRASIAAANQGVALRLLDQTQRLEEQISEYLTSLKS